MAPSRFKKQKFKKRKTVKRLKGKGKIKEKSNRIWIYQKGNILYCFRVPLLRVITYPGDFVHGGGQYNETELSNKLFEQLSASREVNEDYEEDDDGPNLKEILKSYSIYSDKNNLVKALMDSSIKKEVLEELSNPKTKIIAKDKTLNANGKILLKWVKSRKPARKIMIPLFEKMLEKKKNEPIQDEDTDDDVEKDEDNTMDKNEMNYTPEELKEIEDLLNHKRSSSPGILSSMTTNVFSTISKGASSLGSFLTPLLIPDENGIVPKRRNDTFVQLLWFPRSNAQYRKGKSHMYSNIAKSPKYGEFMVYVEPEKYADTAAYLEDRFNSVEDFFANILNGCSDGFCKTGSAIREPLKHQVLQINNYQPEKDTEEQIGEMVPKGELEVKLD